MSHRVSITVGPGAKSKKFFNIASVVKGKRVSADEAVAHAMKTKTMGIPFDTVAEAVKAAKARSKKSVVGKIAHEGLSRKSIKKSS